MYGKEAVEAAHSVLLLAGAEYFKCLGRMFLCLMCPAWETGGHILSGDS